MESKTKTSQYNLFHMVLRLLVLIVHHAETGKDAVAVLLLKDALLEAIHVLRSNELNEATELAAKSRCNGWRIVGLRVVVHDPNAPTTLAAALDTKYLEINIILTIKYHIRYNIPFLLSSIT